MLMTCGLFKNTSSPASVIQRYQKYDRYYAAPPSNFVCTSNHGSHASVMVHRVAGMANILANKFFVICGYFTGITGNRKPENLTHIFKSGNILYSQKSTPFCKIHVDVFSNRLKAVSLTPT